ncbi:hypothetical protein BD779DRAFT_1527370 [Infundibulicybe gibba]|nr:hypothetical protein BD779DRAFT_1527370 [Infundibulicybe gibba]
MDEPIPASINSEKFRAPDADVVFSSSDGVHFRIHSKNLAVNSGVLDPGPTDLQAVAQLTEPASTLEILFQFIYPSRRSDISKLSPDGLFTLGEAVEKYQVFPAMELCCIYIKPLASTHAIRTLSYGLKHDYPDLIDSAAPYTIHYPLQEVVSAIPADRVLHWLAYRQAWDDIMRHHVFALSAIGFSSCNKCGQCEEHLHSMLKYYQIRSRYDRGARVLNMPFERDVKGIKKLSEFGDDLRSELSDDPEYIGWQS